MQAYRQGTEPLRQPIQRAARMSDKSPRQSKSPKSGKSIKEKRADKKAKADSAHTSSMEALTHKKH
jgi:hypothetical protein